MTGRVVWKAIPTSLLWLGIACSSGRNGSHITHGTAIAAIRTSKAFVMAADRRAVDENSRVVADECKIRVVKDLVFAVHGLSSDTRTHFDVFQLVARAAKKESTFDGVLTKIVADIAPELKKTFALTLPTVPNLNYMGILLAQPDKRSATFAYVRFIGRERDGVLTVDVDTKRCPGRDCPSGESGVFVAPPECKEKELARPFTSGDPAVEAASFLQREVDHGHVDIGPPVDLLRITDGRITWLQHPPGCAAK